MNCIVCNTELRLNRAVFANNKVHLQTTCPKCNKTTFVKQTKENLMLFKNTPIEDSKEKLKKEVLGYSKEYISIVK